MNKNPGLLRNSTANHKLGNIGTTNMYGVLYSIGGESIDDATKGKKFRVDIPRTSLTLKTYDEAVELSKILFSVGVGDVQIIAFRPTPENDY